MYTVHIYICYMDIMFDDATTYHILFDFYIRNTIISYVLYIGYISNVMNL